MKESWAGKELRKLKTDMGLGIIPHGRKGLKPRETKTWWVIDGQLISFKNGSFEKAKVEGPFHGRAEARDFIALHGDLKVPSKRS